jgi:hypothetical protein
MHNTNGDHIGEQTNSKCFMKFGYSYVNRSFTFSILLFLNIISSKEIKGQILENKQKYSGCAVNYYFLPSHSRFDIIFFRNRKDFENFIETQKYDMVDCRELIKKGIQLKLTEEKSVNPQLALIKCYKLSNGYIAVDNSAVSKANPFYVVKSIKEILIILNYLLIYYFEDIPVIECKIHNDLEIRNFLQAEPSLREILELSEYGKKYFVSSEGMPIYLRYSEDASAQLTRDADQPNDSNHNSKRKIYHDLVIFQSLEVMKKTRKFHDERFDDDFNGFDATVKKIATSVDSYVEAKVIDKRNLQSILSEDTVEKQDLVLGGYLCLESGSVLFRFSNALYLIFNSYNDYKVYIDARESNLARAERKNSFVDKPKSSFNGLSSLTNEIQVKIEEKILLSEKLGAIDAVVNKYFVDDLFIKQHLLEIIMIIKKIIILNTKGKSQNDDSFDNSIITLDNGKQLDIMPYVFKELLQQRQSGYCSIVAVIEALLAASKFNVLPYSSKN